jgi:hypothetical protein
MDNREVSALIGKEILWGRIGQTKVRVERNDRFVGDDQLKLIFPDGSYTVIAPWGYVVEKIGRRLRLHRA